MPTSQHISFDPPQGPGKALMRPSLQGQPPAPPVPVRTTYLLARPPRNSNLFASNPFSRRLRLQIQKYSYSDPRGNPTPPITSGTSNPTAFSGSGPGTTTPTASSSSNTTATASTMAPTTTSTAATSTILPNIPTDSPAAPILRPTPIYNLASPPLPRSGHKLKITIPDSGYAFAVSKPDNTLDLRRTSLQNPRHLLEFALTPRLGLGQRWVAMWCDSRWVWTRTGWPGEAIWRKTGDCQGGQVVWALEISAVAAAVGGGASEETSADRPVGVRIAGKVGRDVWVESGAGAGVLAGVTEDGLVMLALLTAALVQLM